MSDSRRGELIRRRTALLQRVADAAAAAGRRPEELTVITVTKSFPASDVALLQEMQVLDIGENRAQELASKIAQLQGIQPPLRWHFIGQLQGNKASLVGRECFALHTLDRQALLAPLDRAAVRAGRRLEVFVQLSLDGDPHRGGIAEAQIGPLADAVAGCGGLRLAGLMAVPPLGAEPRPAFARVRAASERLRITHPGATALSAGMSADLEAAVIEGATHLRVGTDLMGSRA
ncbi:MAG TPA: YggS family pyridoxal phosphate-dependent enzyme [Frankiaceae bacterium]|nr:YggS family pyridoxal phosphate-dependent enzyme [Frankiaceae bacterium]